MDRTYYNTKNRNNSFNQIQNTFEALVDSIIPRTPLLAERYGQVQIYGARDFLTDDYMIMTLNQYYIPLANPTAEALNIAANELSIIGGNNRLQYARDGTGIVTFYMLTPYERFLALALLEQYEDYYATLSIDFQNISTFVLSISSSLNRLTLLGYYSEWYGYGATRLQPPSQRVLEFYPLSWEQVDYFGPSLGYRSLRNYSFT